MKRILSCLFLAVVACGCKIIHEHPQAAAQPQLQPQVQTQPAEQPKAKRPDFYESSTDDQNKQLKEYFKKKSAEGEED